MDPGVIGVFIPILAVLGFFGLVGLKTWSAHQLKMRETLGGDSERLFEAVQQLQDEVGSMREDIAEIHERMEFTERMLTEVRSKNAIGPGDSTQ
jgi:predicted negative regulator of RcsB-dependent stress response